MARNPLLLQHKLNESFANFSGNAALECGNRVVTYDELEKRANGMAKGIIGKGAPKEAFIGVLTDDPIDLITAIIGIVTAGGVFVPLDTRYPQKRLETMIDTTDIKWIIGDRTGYQKISASEAREKKTFEFIFIEDLCDSANENIAAGCCGKPEVNYSPEDKIYIYFTSGTTGIPKGILGKNEGLTQFINWEIDTFCIDDTFRFSQFTNPGFDVFLRDIFVPLCAGGTICIPENILSEAEPLIHWIDRQQINLMHCVPSLFRVFCTDALEEKHFKTLKYVMFAGEKVIPGELKHWYDTFGERIQLVNLYGPTETTLAKLYYLIQPSDTDREVMPVGKHIKRARAIVLNENMELCDQLTTGEIYIRTPYRTFGYLNDPQLTAKKFIANPFGYDAGDLLYKTGDLGRLLPDGNIELLGRIDRQVKIRGIRIELDEIENVLIKYPAVREAVVIKKEIDGQHQYLAAGITLAQNRGNRENEDDDAFILEIKGYLSEKFPESMIPADIIILEKIPRTPNGKVNYDEISQQVDMAKLAYVPPGNAVEEKLVDIWSEILRNKKIGVTNGFFQLGGNSLNIMTLIAKIHKEFDIRLTLAEIFRNPTIKKQAELIKGASEDTYVSIEAVEKKEYYALSSAQRRLYVIQQMDIENTAYNLFEIYVTEELDRGRIEEAFRRLIKRHENLRTSFEIIDGIPVQRIHEIDDFAIEYYNAADTAQTTDPEESEAACSMRCADIIENFIRPFDLSRAPLLRVGIIERGQNEHILAVDMHHVISDGRSHNVLTEEFVLLYSGQTLPPLRLQYKDYSQWQNSEGQQEVMKTQEMYWLKQFREEIPLLNLPTDYTRPGRLAVEGKRLAFQIEKESVGKLREILSETETTLYMLLSAVYNVLLSIYTRQGDIIVGSPIGGRRHDNLQNIVGIFVNMLAMRNQTQPNKTFREFLNEVKDNSLNAFENQDYQFDELVDKLDIPRDLSRRPLVETVFTLGNPINRVNPENPGHQYHENGLKVRPYPHEFDNLMFDLTLDAVEEYDSIQGWFTYAAELFKRSTIELMKKHYIEILEQVVENINARLKDIKVSYELVTAKSNPLQADQGDFGF